MTGPKSASVDVLTNIMSARQALHAIPYNTGQLDEACHISNVLDFRTCFMKFLTEKQKPHTFTFLECMVKNFAEYKAGFSSKGDT